MTLDSHVDLESDFFRSRDLKTITTLHKLGGTAHTLLATLKTVYMTEKSTWA